MRNCHNSNAPVISLSSGVSDYNTISVIYFEVEYCPKTGNFDIVFIKSCL